MFKVGDKVIVVGNEAEFGSSKEERNGVGVISDLPYREGFYGVTLDTGFYGVTLDTGFYGVTLDTGFYVAAKPENIHYYAEATVYTTPPEKITQNGYEYSLVGPVKPEWLVNGTWVVNTDNGEKRIVVEEHPGVFNLCIDGLASIRYYDGLRNQYRPHEPKDWKWGDWAMYDGRKVFVIRVGSQGTAVITSQSSNSVIDYVPVSELTPTF